MAETVTSTNMTYTASYGLRYLTLRFVIALTRWLTHKAGIHPVSNQPVTGHKFVHSYMTHVWTQIFPQNLVNSSTETCDLNQLKYVNLRVLNQLYDTCLDTNFPQNLVNSSISTGLNHMFPYLNSRDSVKKFEIRAFTCSERNIATSLLRTGTT